jgi:hypothetical protein
LYWAKRDRIRSIPFFDLLQFASVPAQIVFKTNTATQKTPNRSCLNVLFLLCVSAAIVLPIYFNGIPYGYDLPHHFQCAMAYVESIRAGDLYPSWSLNRNLGFVGMASRLYPQIAH